MTRTIILEKKGKLSARRHARFATFGERNPLALTLHACGFSGGGLVAMGARSLTRERGELEKSDRERRRGFDRKIRRFEDSQILLTRLFAGKHYWTHLPALVD